MARIIGFAFLAVASVASAHAQDAAPATKPADEGKALLKSLGFENASFASASRFRGGLVLSDMRASAMAGGGPDGYAVTARSVRADGAKEAPEGRSYASVTIDGMEADGTKVETTVFGDVTLSATGKARYATVQSRNLRRPSKEGETFVVEGMLMSGSDWRDGIATKGSLQVRGISVSGGKATMGAALMPDLPKSADLDAGWTIDPDAGRMTLQDLTIWYGKVALLRGSFALSGVDAKRIAELNATPPSAGKPSGEGRAKAADAVSSVRLETLSLRLENTGLVQSLLSAKALIDGSTPDKVAGDVAKGIEALWPAKAGDPALRAQALKAFRTFMANPRSLSVRLAPAPGGVDILQSAMEAYSGKGNAAALGITIEANAPDRRPSTP